MMIRICPGDHGAAGLQLRVGDVRVDQPVRVDALVLRDERFDLVDHVPDVHVHRRLDAVVVVDPERDELS